MTTFHDSPSSLVDRFVAAFNAGDADAVERLYEPGGLIVPVPGQATTERRAAIDYLLSLRQPMRATVRHCFVSGDVALLVVDWSVGEFGGSAADVVRLVDGRWRYLIDNPHGTAAAR
jgi:ketosteroid isomerase-like protein